MASIIRVRLLYEWPPHDTSADDTARTADCLSDDFAPNAGRRRVRALSREKRHRQRPRKGLVLWLTELGEPDRGTARRPSPIGPQGAVPKREDRREVTVGIRRRRGVVDLVYGRSDEDTADPRFDGRRNPGIGMLEDRDAARNATVQQHPKRRQPQRRDRNKRGRIRQQRLDGVEAQACGVVEVDVGVVDSVNRPEEWDGMEDAVLEIKCEVEETHGGRDRQPPHETTIKREAPTAVRQK